MPSFAAIPREFSSLLSERGKRLLDHRDKRNLGALSDPRRRFLSLEGLISQTKADALRKALDKTFYDYLVPLSAPIPPETIDLMRRNNDDWLPKCVRVKTAYLENRREDSYRRAMEIGLISLLSSESLHAFAEAIVGRKLDRKNGQQILCYGAGDYTGPHTDHYPRLKRAARGYVDLHISLTNSAVKDQYLIYAKGGHWTEMIPVHRSGCITLYRLPFWHMTTPLRPKKGKEKEARRWLLLSTFYYKGKGD